MGGKKKRHWLDHLSFGSLSLAASGLLLLSYLSMVINPARAWFFTLFGLLYPLVYPLTAGLFIWALLRRSRLRGWLLLVLLPAFFLTGRYFRFRGPESDREASLKILSYNVGLFAHGNIEDRLALADSVSRWLLAQDADIVCLQEFYLPRGKHPGQWLQQHFPSYRAEYYLLSNRNGQFGNVILSRRPIVGKGKIDFENSTNMALWADVRLDSGTVRIYDCHFESYNISLSGLVKKGTAVEDTERKMRRSISERPKQVAEVLRGMDAAPVRSLALGDFNDSPLSYTYFRLSQGRKDSFARAGKGFGATYRSLWPLLRIDYILYPPELEAVSCEMPHVRYSDHYPVIATYYETGRNLR